ncbi:hypothetical protein ES703_122202 [subsurface metagenome]
MDNLHNHTLRQKFQNPRFVTNLKLILFLPTLHTQPATAPEDFLLAVGADNAGSLLPVGLIHFSAFLARPGRDSTILRLGST